MSQKQQRSAQRRAEKRHRREVERRQARTAARKRSVATHERDDFIDDDFMPSADEETSDHPYLTQREREREFGASRTPGRWKREMPGFWTHAEVAALADEALFAELADRALVVKAADVLGHIARMPAGGSAWRMSRIYWLPAILTYKPSAADRDFMGLAAVELWRRLRPEDPPVETLFALLADAEELRDDDPPGHLAGLVRFLAEARVRMDPDRPDEFSGIRLATSPQRVSLVIVASRLAREHPELAADALAEIERWSDFVSADDSAADRQFFEQLITILCDALGRHEDAERRLRIVLARTPDDLVTRKLLALQLVEHPDGDRTRLVEALELWDTARPPDDDPGIDRFLETREQIVESLQEHDAEAEAGPRNALDDPAV